MSASFGLAPGAVATRSSELPAPRGVSRRPDFWMLTGLAILALFVAIGIAAPLLAPHNPATQNLVFILKPPSIAHPFGTDYLGRDLLSRLIWGTRISLVTLGLVVGLSSAIGATVGLVAGVSRGWLDELLMRLTDLFLMVPSFVLALALAGIRGPGLESILLALVISGWPAHARLVRSVVVTNRAQPYVDAAVELGASRRHIVLRHLAPAAVGPMLVLTSLEAGHTLMQVAALSFLGVGIQPPNPEWGTMLADAQRYFLIAPHLIVFPGLAILVVTLGLNLLAERYASRLSRRLRNL